MRLWPELYVWDDEFNGGCAVYPHGIYPDEAKGMYSKEQINSLIESIAKCFDSDSQLYLASSIVRDYKIKE